MIRCDALSKIVSLRMLLCAVLAAGAACSPGGDGGSTSDAGDAGPNFCPPSGIDAGSPAATVDAGSTDAGATVDAGSTDAGATVDAGSTDAGATADASSGALSCLPRRGSQADGGSECSFDECSVNTDCCGGAACRLSLPTCFLCTTKAVTDCSACLIGQFCQNVGNDGACQCPQGPIQVCTTSCATRMCASGEVCTPVGTCVPMSCSAGYQCKVWAACSPTTLGADIHGCLGNQCRLDTDCMVGGFCLNGRCELSQGTCF